jgi:nucleoside-diphosphate-sugar epimerase
LHHLPIIWQIESNTKCDLEDTDWDLSVDPNGDFTADNEFATAMKVYSASKLLANQASWEFIEKEKPGFALVTIHPSLVYGHNLIQQSVKELEGSTNGLFFSSIMNGPASDGALLSVYVGDVADAHVLALKPEIKSGSKYLTSGRPYTWKDVVEILEKHYPGVAYKVTAAGAAKAEKDFTPPPTKVDTSKAEKELGIEWAATETIVTEVMNQQLSFFK